MISNNKNQRVAKRITLKNKTWDYRGEGNANLVLSLPEEKKIIRLRKSLSYEKRREEDRIWLEIDFCAGVMLPLIGERFVNVPTAVRLPESELAELNEELKAFRPQHRHNKGLYTNYAALFPDLCFLPGTSCFWQPTFCIEIKPKEGWIPTPDRILSKCTFCLNQYLKLKQGSITEKSQYCPWDLFSGNRSRMKFAIKALLFSPQNNFKIFKNGRLVYGDSTEKFEPTLEEWFGFSDTDKLIENLVKVVVDALLSDFADADNETFFSQFPLRLYEMKRELHSHIPQHLLDEVRNLLQGPSCYSGATEPLPSNCILSRILRIQKLEVLGFDEVHRMYSSECGEDFDHVYDMLLSPTEVFKPINSYLLATTAKDCSILIAFQKTPSYVTDYEFCVKDSNDVYYNFNIGVSDLDPKPASCIEKHKKRNIDVVLSCIDVLRSYK